MRILIADDHALFRDGLRLQLQALDASAEVLEAADFDAALAQASEPDSPALIMIDLGMPGMDWRQALPLLCQRCPGSSVVVVSASDARDDILVALDKAAGCERAYRECAIGRRPSGAERDWPRLKALLKALEAGDVVVVTRLDRLARSIRALLQVNFNGPGGDSGPRKESPEPASPP